MGNDSAKPGPAIEDMLNVVNMLFSKGSGNRLLSRLAA
jgi:hypothetical protein